MAKNDNSDYPIGYKKPPSHTQFKPGKSGNPKGRPKKATTVTDAFSKEARKIVTVRTKSGGKKMSMLDLIAKRHFGQAANGDHKSAALVMRALKPSESEQDNNLPELLEEFRKKNAQHVAADISEIGRQMTTNETDPTNSGSPIDPAKKDS